jgi:hypothetical protein
MYLAGAFDRGRQQGMAIERAKRARNQESHP